MKWKVIVYKDGTYKWLKESEPVTPDENWLVTIPAAVDEQPGDKDKEIELHKKHNVILHDKLQEALNQNARDYQEIERLKGLIEKAFYTGYWRNHPISADMTERNSPSGFWQQFITENNL